MFVFGFSAMSVLIADDKPLTQSANFSADVASILASAKSEGLPPKISIEMLQNIVDLIEKQKRIY